MHGPDALSDIWILSLLFPQVIWIIHKYIDICAFATN